MRARCDRPRSDVRVGRGGAYNAWQSACASGGRWICAQVCWYAYEKHTGPNPWFFSSKTGCSRDTSPPELEAAEGAGDVGKRQDVRCSHRHAYSSSAPCAPPVAATPPPTPLLHAPAGRALRSSRRWRSARPRASVRSTSRGRVPRSSRCCSPWRWTAAPCTSSRRMASRTWTSCLRARLPVRRASS